MLASSLITIKMKCYLCDAFSDYLCSCSYPSIPMCNGHLPIHIKDKSKKHTLSAVEDPLINSLYIEMNEKLNKITNELISHFKIKSSQIEQNLRMWITQIHKIKENLYNKYLEKTLDNTFSGEILADLKKIHKINQETLQRFICEKE